MATSPFRELSPLASHLLVAALAISIWVFVVAPLWKRCHPRLVLFSPNKLLLTRLLDGIIMFLVFALGAAVKQMPVVTN
jgi:hypothetical protein